MESPPVRLAIISDDSSSNDDDVRVRKRKLLKKKAIDGYSISQADKPPAKRSKLTKCEPIKINDQNNASVLPISTTITKSVLQSWTEPQLLAEIQNLDFQTSQNIIKLFKNDNTIPFICRYRKELIGDMTPDM